MKREEIACRWLENFDRVYEDGWTDTRGNFYTLAQLLSQYHFEQSAKEEGQP